MSKYLPWCMLLIVLMGMPFTGKGQFKTVKLHKLQGMIDSSGTTHLFYRKYEVNPLEDSDLEEMKNHLYHLNPATGRDTVFLEEERTATYLPSGYYFDSEYVEDIIFTDSSITSYAYIKSICATDCSSYLKYTARGITVELSSWLGGYGDLTLDPHNIDRFFSTREFSDNRSWIYHKDNGGWTRSSTSTDSADLDFKLLSVHPYRDSLYYGRHWYDLVRSDDLKGFTVVDSTHDLYGFNTFYYGRDSTMFIRKTDGFIKDNYSIIYRSNELGQAGSWQIMQEDTIGFVPFSVDPYQDRIFTARGSTLMVSSNEGRDYTSVLTFNNQITGIYKPKKRNTILYVSTITDIWKMRGTSVVESLKHVDAGISEKNSNVPSKVILEQNYPNPFNPTTKIRFRLPTASEVTLRVYNSIGQRIETLANRQMRAGSHSVTFNAEGLPSGVYIYQLKTENYSKSRKMLLLK